MASSMLRYNNPNIADLSDENRPTKIAEKMSELYDNQWTDAYDALQNEMDEKDIIKFLLDILMVHRLTYSYIVSKIFKLAWISENIMFMHFNMDNLCTVELRWLASS